MAAGGARRGDYVRTRAADVPGEIGEEHLGTDLLLPGGLPPLDVVG